MGAIGDPSAAAADASSSRPWLGDADTKNRGMAATADGLAEPGSPRARQKVGHTDDILPELAALGVLSLPAKSCSLLAILTCFAKPLPPAAHLYSCRVMDVTDRYPPGADSADDADDAWPAAPTQSGPNVARSQVSCSAENGAGGSVSAGVAAGLAISGNCVTG